MRSSIVKKKPALCLVAAEKDDGQYHGFAVQLDFVFPNAALTIEDMKARLLAAMASSRLPTGTVTIQECKPNPLSGLVT